MRWQTTVRTVVVFFVVSTAAPADDEWTKTTTRRRGENEKQKGHYFDFSLFHQCIDFQRSIGYENFADLYMHIVVSCATYIWLDREWTATFLHAKSRASRRGQVTHVEDTRRRAPDRQTGAIILDLWLGGGNFLMDTLNALDSFYAQKFLSLRQPFVESHNRHGDDVIPWTPLVFGFDKDYSVFPRLEKRVKKYGNRFPLRSRVLRTSSTGTRDSLASNVTTMLRGGLRTYGPVQTTSGPRRSSVFRRAPIPAFAMRSLLTETCAVMVQGQPFQFFGDRSFETYYRLYWQGDTNATLREELIHGIEHSHLRELCEAALQSVCDDREDCGIFVVLDSPPQAALEWDIINRYCRPRLVFVNNVNLPGHAGWVREHLLFDSRWKEIFKNSSVDNVFRWVKPGDPLSSVFTGRVFSLLAYVGHE